MCNAELIEPFCSRFAQSFLFSVIYIVKDNALYVKMECQKCNGKIAPTKWSRHVRSLKHLKIDPDQTIPPRRRGRPKIKPDPHQAIKPRRRTINVTGKELFKQVKEYDMNCYTKWNKQQLLSVVRK